MKSRRRKWLRQYDPNVILCHTGLSEDKNKAFEAYVNLVLNRYIQCCDVEIARRERIVEAINLALAAIIGHEIEFDYEDESAPFSDEESALIWLKGEVEYDCVSPYEFFDFSFNENYSAKALWNVRCDAERCIEHLMAIEEQWWENLRSSPPWEESFASQKSRMNPAVQSLIYDLCVCWFEHVDEELSLPAKTPGRDNPLLRYIDGCLGFVLPADVAPSKDTVKIFLFNHVRPYFREMAPEWRRQKEEAERDREQREKEWELEFYSSESAAERAKWELEALNRHEEARQKEKLELLSEIGDLKRRMRHLDDLLAQYDDIRDADVVDLPTHLGR